MNSKFHPEMKENRNHRVHREAYLCEERSDVTSPDGMASCHSRSYEAGIVTPAFGRLTKTPWGDAPNPRLSGSPSLPLFSLCALWFNYIVNEFLSHYSLSHSLTSLPRSKR